MSFDFSSYLPDQDGYVVTPAWVIASAFSQDPPKKSLLGNYERLLSLSWDRKGKDTPALPEEFFYDGFHPDGIARDGFMRMNRRQFYQMLKEMKELGWLRSARPRAGFVQFLFLRSSELSQPDASAENRTDDAKNRTPLMRIEEDESLKLNNINPPQSSSEEEVRKIAPEMLALVENLHLLFEPDVHGLLEWRDEFATGLPEYVKGWIAKAYQDRERLNQPIGFVVRHILNRDKPNPYFLTQYLEILPEEYLEACGEVEYSCLFCSLKTGTFAALETHRREAHPHVCDDCVPPKEFADAETLRAHWMGTHDPLRIRTETPKYVPNLNADDPAVQAWEKVKVQLQAEMPRASFDTWVRDSRAVRFDGNALVICTRNVYARDWLENRLEAKVSQLVGAHAEGITSVQFVVGNEIMEGA